MTKMNYEAARRRDLARTGISVESGPRGTFGGARDKRRTWQRKKSPPGTGRELWTWGTRYRNQPVCAIPWQHLMWVLENTPPEHYRLRGCALTELQRRFPCDFTGTLADYDREFDYQQWQRATGRTDQSEWVKTKVKTHYPQSNKK